MKQIIIIFVQVMALFAQASGNAWAATGKEGPMAKVDQALAVVYEEQESYLARGGGVAFTPSNPLLRVSAGRVLIDAVASGDVQALRADLEAFGMQGAVAFDRIVSGGFPIDAMDGMAALPSLQFARPSLRDNHRGTGNEPG